MHLSKRTKMSILFSMVALVTIVGASFALAARSSVARAASSASGAVVYHGTAGKVTRIATSLATRNAQPAIRHPRATPFHAHKTLARVAAPFVPASAAANVQLPEGTVKHNFNGISDVDQAAVNGGSGVGEVTPPDQGLCVGRDPGVPKKTVVFELVNDSVRETSSDGTALPGTPLLSHDVSVTTFFEPNAFSDPRCFFDTSTNTFYFTIIGFNLSGPDKNQTSIDVAVFNAHGFAVYQVDSSFGGQDFGDQPHVGFDNNALYASVDEFNVPGTVYFGAALFVLSKSQLVSEVASPNLVVFGPVSLGGIPVLTLEPAVSTTSVDTEYLMNSFPFTDADNTPNPTSHLLGLWRVTGDKGVTTGDFDNVILQGRLIQSETYGFPVPAVSTGTGAIVKGIESEPALNPDDSRMLQVQYINGRLWASLITAIAIGNDPVTRDGIAWFKVDPVGASVKDQGYVAATGEYLIYPAIMHTAEGTTAITFTVTSATINPSAAYVLRKSGSSHFGSIHVTGAGNGPHLSFSDTLPPGIARPRWGDYSAAVLDQNGHDIWLATEYIPPAANQDPFDNWGTRVFDVVGDQ